MLQKRVHIRKEASSNLECAYEGYYTQSQVDMASLTLYTVDIYSDQTTINWIRSLQCFTIVEYLMSFPVKKHGTSI